MAHPSDQHPDFDRLSSTARGILGLRDEVFSEWEKRVRTLVKGAEKLKRPILIDTLPAFYDNIAESLAPHYPRTNATDSNTIASEHGGERARLTQYETENIVHEYQIFRTVFLEALLRNGIALTAPEILTVNTSIDNAIRESVTSFALVQAAFREQFIASLTHDLRNPLSAANAAAELIAYTTDSVKTRNLAQKIIENNNRMDKMIQDLLDTMLFHGGDRLALDLSSFDILDLMNEVHQELKHAPGQRFEIIGDSVKGYWSRGSMKRVIENLLDNAVKYGAPEKPIRIRISEVHGRLLLAVHNEGNPIPPDQTENIFQIFRRAHAARQDAKQGWGVGLSYVRRVAESHGGSVSVDSSLERGTTFTVDIPVDSRPYQDAPSLDG